MFLKSLTLKGFKSFADATAMHLEPGVTVVVGPNGSGKSNVVDAIAWVLGAQAPSAVRSQKMDDVIFAGTAKRPALGRAEVSLTIDNSAGLLDLEFTEVTVSRILFRNGDSEYSINGVPCRLLDVQELLSDAGVGRQQHVIISQGQIDAVLNARPEDRRAIIEEAAGVLKFRKRREKAERRLNSTEANLLRVQDLIREVRRQLKPLERQAQAAQRHDVLVGELRALQLYVAGREIAGLRTTLSRQAAARVDHQRTETEVKSELAKLDTEVASLEATLSARGEDDVGDRLMHVDQLRERARSLRALIAERRRGIERDKGQLLDAGLVATLENDVAELRAEVTSVDQQLAAIGPEHEALQADEATFQHEREHVLESLAEPTSNTAASAMAEVRGELRSLTAALHRSESDRRRDVEHRQQLAGRLERVAGDVETHRQLVADTEAQVDELDGAREQAADALGAAESALDDATRARQDAADASSRWTARVEALQLALDAARARAGAEALADADGVLGTLLDLVKIDAGWEEAVEAAMGEALQAVVVRDVDAARRALDSLRAADTAGAVLALGVGSSAASSRPSTGEPVRPHVRASLPEVDALVDRLLGTAVRVPDLIAAATVAVDHPEAVVVTSAGDRYGPTGWRVGAAASGGVTAVALEEAQAEAEAAAAALANAKTDEQQVRDALRDAQAAARDAAKRADANASTLSSASEAIEREERRQTELTAELESLTQTVTELDAHIDGERARIAEFEAVIPRLEADEAAEAEAARHRDERRAELDARAALLASRRRDLEVRSAGLTERRELLERRIDEAEHRLATDKVARDEAAARRIQLERTLKALVALGELVEARQQIIDVEHAKLTEQRRRQSDEVRQLTARLNDARRQRAGAEQRLEENRERARRVDHDETETKLRLENAIELVRRDLDVEPNDAEAAEQPELPDGVTAKAKVRELERELRLLGPINPLALEEFNELEQRHTFLDEQLNDVRTTRRELMQVIKAVDTEIQTVFSAAFMDVSANFTYLFETLFPGGSGKLILTQPDDLLNTGIEVEAKPSGKNVKKLSLLSGGERSLTALAYLFAVFRSRPSPFYVMDEVEAALDDVNLHRFLGLVGEFRKDAQLLIVSHQKRTMEAGDCLLGVTMQPGGSSKVITERVETEHTAS